MNFSKELTSKIESIKANSQEVNLGSISFANRLILAPLAGITDAPFRLLMEDLGAGGTVSELISCHAVTHGNKKTQKMITPDEREKNVAIQLFGEDAGMMAEAAVVAQERGSRYIDINMGCPVRKVVTKGGGSALLQEPEKLYDFLKPIKDAIKVPMTVKIRTGWDTDSLNADTVIKTCVDAGAEFISLHGRTRSQHYSGLADWNYIEEMAKISPVPLVGNGDLHTSEITKNRLENTNCPALMLGRGPLRNPFIFLESLSDKEVEFTASDYLEVIERYKSYVINYTDREHVINVQMRKMIVWFAAGYQNVAAFRRNIFQAKELEQIMEVTNAYFLGLGNNKKQINHGDPFLAGGHG